MKLAAKKSHASLPVSTGGNENSCLPSIVSSESDCCCCCSAWWLVSAACVKAVVLSPDLGVCSSIVVLMAGDVVIVTGVLVLMLACLQV